jgi:hypothetical protein
MGGNGNCASLYILPPILVKKRLNLVLCVCTKNYATLVQIYNGQTLALQYIKACWNCIISTKAAHPTKTCARDKTQKSLRSITFIRKACWDPLCWIRSGVNRSTCVCSRRGDYEEFYLPRYSGTWSAERQQTFRGNISASCWFLDWFILRPWTWRRHVPPKHQLIFKRQHGAITQKTESFTFMQ